MQTIGILENFARINNIKIRTILSDQIPIIAGDQAQLQQAADDFHAELASKLGSDYPVVTEPGPDVLHLRAALTGSVP
ncbi:MAG: DUF3313 family protein, partial [Candidatus Sifarchaeia archaeon]